MFAHLESRTYFLFAGLNLLWMPIVFLFYPETMDRTLESIDTMFSTKRPFYKDMEAAYKRAGNGDVLAARHMQHDTMDKGAGLDTDSAVSHSEKV